MKLALGLWLGIAASAAVAAPVEVRPYGTMPDGRQVNEYVLRNARGAEVHFINYGGIVTEIDVSDRRGRKANVVLGFSSLADYVAKNGDYRFGAIVGRYSGRIAGAGFTVGGKDVRLTPNDGPNALHGGGLPGTDSQYWTVTAMADRPGAVLRLISPDGEQGFPGALNIEATYRLLPDDSFRIDYATTTNAATAINFTNHSYFNLAGAGSGSVLGERLKIDSDRYADADTGGVPTGAFLPVAGTALDFRKSEPLRQCLKIRERGCNDNFVLPFDGTLKLAATLSDPKSGRVMDVLTTEPSLVVYTAGYMSGKDVGAQGKPYRAFDGIALEAQHLSDSPHNPDFPTTLLQPGQVYRATTIYRFRAR